MIELKNVSKVFTTKKGNVEALKSTSLQVKRVKYLESLDIVALAKVH